MSRPWREASPRTGPHRVVLERRGPWEGLPQPTTSRSSRCASAGPPRREALAMDVAPESARCRRIPTLLSIAKGALRGPSSFLSLAAGAARLPQASLRMSSNEISPSEELVRLTRLAHEAQGLSVLVHAQYELRSAMRRAFLLQQWSDLESVQHELAGSAPLAARFSENLHHVLETPELSASEPFGRLHGLVLAIPVAITCKAGMLASLPHPLGSAFRESLQERFPGNVAMRLVNRLVPQLVAHGMEARSLYEMIRELASGGSGPAAQPESQPATAFRPHGRSQGQHYLFALALAPHHEDLAHYGDLQTDPGLIKWSAAQTEAITSNFAERGWPLLMRVATPQRLGEMLSSPLLLSDVERDRRSARPCGIPAGMPGHRARGRPRHARRRGARIEDRYPRAPLRQTRGTRLLPAGAARR